MACAEASLLETSFLCESILYGAFRQGPWCEPPTSCMAWSDGTLACSRCSGMAMVRSHAEARRHACSVYSYGDIRSSTHPCGPAWCQPSLGSPHPPHDAAIGPDMLVMDKHPSLTIIMILKMMTNSSKRNRETTQMVVWAQDTCVVPVLLAVLMSFALNSNLYCSEYSFLNSTVLSFP